MIYISPFIYIYIYLSFIVYYEKSSLPCIFITMKQFNDATMYTMYYCNIRTIDNLITYTVCDMGVQPLLYGT